MRCAALLGLIAVGIGVGDCGQSGSSESAVTAACRDWIQQTCAVLVACSPSSGTTVDQCVASSDQIGQCTTRLGTDPCATAAAFSACAERSRQQLALGCTDCAGGFCVSVCTQAECTPTGDAAAD